MPIGKYKGKHIDSIVSDKAHCNWYLKKPWFKRNYPIEYQYLDSLFNAVESQNKKTMFLYCLVLSDGFGIKVGKTTNYVPKRLYDYVCATHNYTRYIDNYPIKVKKSFVFKTNDLNIERHIKNVFKDFRIDGKSELFNVGFEYIENEIKLKSNENKNLFYYKKPLFDFIPYDSMVRLRKEFVIYADKYPQFQIEYEKHLSSRNLLRYYEPNFIGGNLN